MKFDGNYRQETWTREGDASGQDQGLIGFVVDDEQVTLTYELWEQILRDLGFEKASDK